MITWKSEVVAIAYEDGEKVAMLHQNGEIEVYRLKRATKTDLNEFLQIENPI